MVDDIVLDKTERQMRQMQRVKIKKGDRVGAAATNWYAEDHKKTLRFPILYGSVISCSEFSAYVYWDLDEEASNLPIDKLTILDPNEAEVYQDIEDLDEDTALAPKRLHPALRSVVHASGLSSSDSDQDQQFSKPQIRLIPQIKIINATKKEKNKIINKNDATGIQRIGEDMDMLVTGDEQPSSSTTRSTSRIPKRAAKAVIKKVAPQRQKKRRVTLNPKKRGKNAKVTDKPLYNDQTGFAFTSSESDLESSSDGSDGMSILSDEEDPSVTSSSLPSVIVSEESQTKRKVPKTAEEKKQMRLQAEKDFGWANGGRLIDARGGASSGYGPKLKGFDSTNQSPMNYFCHFFPFRYLRESILPLTNAKGKRIFGSDWKNDVTVGEFCIWIGIRFAQCYIKLPEINDYWTTVNHGVFPGLNMGQFMSKKRFWQINAALQVHPNNDEEEQVLGFIEVLNTTFQEALTPGDCLTIDESMISSRHKNLKGKKKIKRKPRPIGTEIKNLADSRSKINLVLEKNENKDIMACKEGVDEHGATTACTLRLTTPYHGSGRVVFGDSWFGSIKTAVELKKVGLHSTLMVKTAHKKFPKELFVAEGPVTKGETKFMFQESEGLIAAKYQDKKLKQLVSTFATSLPGNPRLKKSRRTGEVQSIPRPKIFADYCEYAGAIDNFNHYRTGGTALEDSWKTLSPFLRQLGGLLGFVETNAYVASKFFGNSLLDHGLFRRELANFLLTNKLDAPTRICLRRPLKNLVPVTHKLERMTEQTKGKCFVCSNIGAVRVELTTVWYCICCPKKPLCSPTTGRSCFTDHAQTGKFPPKVYRKQAKNSTQI